MKQIAPYKTRQNALAALDNGGRFYNIFTESDDGEIAESELAKVAGVFSNSQKMCLYLEMSLAELDSQAANDVRAAMSEELQSVHKRYKPVLYTPSQAVAHGVASTSAIITGIPHYITSKSDFTGFIMIPISAGKVMTFVMVPMVDHYDVYEVYDLETTETFIVAHTRGAAKLSQNPTRFGGILKKMQKNRDSESEHTLYLEALYYSSFEPVK